MVMGGDTQAAVVEAGRVALPAVIPPEPDPELVERLPVEWPLAPGVAPKLRRGWNRETAVRIVQQIANGTTVGKACEAVGLSRDVYEKWHMVVKPLREMHQAARIMQANALFDRALDTAAENAERPLNEVKNSAIRILVDTLKWAAGKLNPQEYGERALPHSAITVKIVTNLDIDDEAVARKQLEPIDMEESEGIYVVKAPLQPTGPTPTGPAQPGSEATVSSGAPRKRGRPGTENIRGGTMKKGTKVGPRPKRLEEKEEAVRAAEEEAKRQDTV